jgi:hypothetical protein
MRITGIDLFELKAAPIYGAHIENSPQATNCDRLWDVFSDNDCFRLRNFT